MPQRHKLNYSFLLTISMQSLFPELLLGGARRLRRLAPACP